MESEPTNTLAPRATVHHHTACAGAFFYPIFLPHFPLLQTFERFIIIPLLK